MRPGVLIRLAVVVGVCASASSASAHHSYGAFFDLCKRVTIEGRVEAVQWKAPHVSIDMTTDDGTPYVAEWTGLQNLGRAGVTAATVKAGDRLTVTGSPFKPRESIDPAFKEYVDRSRNFVSALVQVRRASDGWSWSLPGGGALPQECRK